MSWSGQPCGRWLLCLPSPRQRRAPWWASFSHRSAPILSWLPSSIASRGTPRRPTWSPWTPVKPRLAHSTPSLANKKLQQSWGTLLSFHALHWIDNYRTKKIEMLKKKKTRNGLNKKKLKNIKAEDVHCLKLQSSSPRSSFCRSPPKKK